MEIYKPQNFFILFYAKIYENICFYKVFSCFGLMFIYKFVANSLNLCCLNKIT